MRINDAYDPPVVILAWLAEESTNYLARALYILYVGSVLWKSFQTDFTNTRYRSINFSFVNLSHETGRRSDTRLSFSVDDPANSSFRQFLSFVTQVRYRRCSLLKRIHFPWVDLLQVGGAQITASLEANLKNSVCNVVASLCFSLCFRVVRLLNGSVRNVKSSS